MKKLKAQCILLHLPHKISSLHKTITKGKKVLLKNCTSIYNLLIIIYIILYTSYYFISFFEILPAILGLKKINYKFDCVPFKQKEI